MTWHCSGISEDSHRFAQNLQHLLAKLFFVIVSEQFYYRNNNNFVNKCCKFLANLCKSSEILEHCHVKWWLKYQKFQNNRSVSWRLSTTSNANPEWNLCTQTENATLKFHDPILRPYTDHFYVQLLFLKVS